jgi:hypothetical protein
MPLAADAAAAQSSLSLIPIQTLLWSPFPAHLSTAKIWGNLPMLSDYLSSV